MEVSEIDEVLFYQPGGHVDGEPALTTFRSSADSILSEVSFPRVYICKHVPTLEFSYIKQPYLQSLRKMLQRVCRHSQLTTPRSSGIQSRESVCRHLVNQYHPQSEISLLVEVTRTYVPTRAFPSMARVGRSWTGGRKSVGQKWGSWELDRDLIGRGHRRSIFARGVLFIGINANGRWPRATFSCSGIE